MAVYVDGSKNRYGRLVMCHMLADTPAELFAMVDRIGVDRRHYQGFEKASCPHFDIAKSKRLLAVEAGAVAVDRDQLRDVLRRIKAAAVADVRAGKKHGWEEKSCLHMTVTVV